MSLSSIAGCTAKRAASGYGQKEQGGTISTFDRYAVYSAEWQGMTARIRFLDAEGFASQIIYPTLGIIWKGELSDPELAAALCRAYNRWAFDLVEGHRQRLFPAAHISIREPALAVEELHRVAKLGCRIALVAAMPVQGKSFGHPAYDLVWAAAQDLDIAIGLHVVSHHHYMGNEFCREPKPGLMYFTMYTSLRSGAVAAGSSIVLGAHTIASLEFGGTRRSFRDIETKAEDSDLLAAILNRYREYATRKNAVSSAASRPSVK